MQTALQQPRCHYWILRVGQKCVAAYETLRLEFSSKFVLKLHASGDDSPHGLEPPTRRSKEMLNCNLARSI